MARLARSCGNCSAFTCMCWLNGSALLGSSLQGAWGMMRPFCWCPVPLTSSVDSLLHNLVSTSTLLLFNPSWHFQRDMLKINFFSSVAVINNYFSVYCYFCYRNISKTCLCLVCLWCCTTQTAGARICSPEPCHPDTCQFYFEILVTEIQGNLRSPPPYLCPKARI